MNDNDMLKSAFNAVSHDYIDQRVHISIRLSKAADYLEGFCEGLGKHLPQLSMSGSFLRIIFHNIVTLMREAAKVTEADHHDLLRDARRYVDEAAQMHDDISRHSPLPPEAQAKHDERNPARELLNQIDAALEDARPANCFRQSAEALLTSQDELANWLLAEGIGDWREGENVLQVVRRLLEQAYGN